MKTHNRVWAVLVITTICGSVALAADDAILRQAFDLGAPRTPQPQRFEMETQVISYALDGKRTGTDIYRIHLQCTPGRGPNKDTDEYTCTKFTAQFAGASEVAIPALKDWTYLFKHSETGLDEKGQVFGIDHAKFEGLIDANGQAIPIDKSYHVYNAFIDFHGFCDTFAAPVPGGKGIQDLKRIGEKIVHAAAFTEPPVNLGSGIAEGSTFKNGEVTLELKGLSLVDGAACALVAFDSGASSFQMTVKPMPNMEVRSVGSSHYKGDLYIDLATRWVRKVVMDEMVVAESTVPMLPNKVNAVIERLTTIRNVTAGREEQAADRG